MSALRKRRHEPTPCAWCGEMIRASEMVQRDKDGSEYHAGNCFLEHCLAVHEAEQSHDPDQIDLYSEVVPDEPWPHAGGFP